MAASRRGGPAPRQLMLFDGSPSGDDRGDAGAQSTAGAAADAAAAAVAAAVAAAGGDAAPTSTATAPRRDLWLAGRHVAYELRRSRRRSIGFVVGAQGLRVAAPRWVTVSAIESALGEKAAWIVRKLDEQRDRQTQHEAARVRWVDGARVPYLGATLRLVLDPRAAPPRLLPDPPAALLQPLPDPLTAPSSDAAVLHLALPTGAAESAVGAAVRAWLQRQALALFRERCAQFAGPLGVQPRKVSLSTAATRWGSASIDGSIRLNWRLIHLAPALIDYVVVHELAHLRQMNHGPAFWALVRSLLPDCDDTRRALRRAVLPPLD